MRLSSTFSWHRLLSAAIGYSILLSATVCGASLVVAIIYNNLFLFAIIVYSLLLSVVIYHSLRFVLLVVILFCNICKCLQLSIVASWGCWSAACVLYDSPTHNQHAKNCPSYCCTKIDIPARLHCNFQRYIANLSDMATIL